MINVSVWGSSIAQPALFEEYHYSSQTLIIQTLFYGPYLMSYLRGNPDSWFPSGLIRVVVNEFSSTQFPIRYVPIFSRVQATCLSLFTSRMNVVTHVPEFHWIQPSARDKASYPPHRRPSLFTVWPSLRWGNFGNVQMLPELGLYNSAVLPCKTDNQSLFPPVIRTASTIFCQTLNNDEKSCKKGSKVFFFN